MQVCKKCHRSSASSVHVVREKSSLRCLELAVQLTDCSRHEIPGQWTTSLTTFQSVSCILSLQPASKPKNVQAEPEQPEQVTPEAPHQCTHRINAHLAMMILTAISRHADIEIPVPSISFSAYSLPSLLKTEAHYITYAVSTFTPRSSHILISMFTHSPLLASRLAAGRRSASWAR